MNVLLEDVKLSFCEWLRLENNTVIDVDLGTVVANSLPGDPVNPYNVGPPSTGKTETTPYCWRLSDHCCELIRTSEIYDTGDDSWDFNLDEAEDLNTQSPGVAVGA
jgi:hypothetical protein